ncbi:MAG TPA: tetratricopeptide repeat protein, partial [Blastocatellia bacterium]|nr:tetratricopeptide repeat protein [Blastocatellia bacterium]
LPFKLAGEQEPGGPDSFLLDAALSAIKREETARAEQFVKYSLDTKDTARGHDLKGEILSARGDDQGSIDEWRQALILDPNYFYTLIDLGKYYLKKQDITGAVPYLDRAVEADPANARGHHLRGLAYQAAGDFDRAIQEYSKALPDAEYTKDIANFYLNYGTALVSAGDYQEAARMFEEHVHLHPEDFEGHYQLGAADEVLAERSVKDVYTADAISELKKALTAKPDYPMAHYYLSKAYRRLGMEAESEDEFALYERFLPK